LLLVLTLLAVIYLLVRRKWKDLQALPQHRWFQQADAWLSQHVPRIWSFIRQRFTVHQWRGLALTGSVFVVFIAIYLFTLVTEGWVDEEALYHFDQGIYQAVASQVNEPITAFMSYITHLADTATIAGLGILLCGVLLYRRYYWQVIALITAIGVGSGLMVGLKWIFSRARPGDRLTDAWGHSFPSGHSFAAMTFYGFLIYLAWRFIDRDAYRIAATFALALTILLVGLSRIVLRVHWVSDIAGGFTFGLAWLVCSLLIQRGIRVYWERRHLTPAE
jgi:undecaprenyl-diphosphatase